MPEEGSSQDVRQERTNFRFQVDHRDLPDVVEECAVRIERTDGMWKLRDLDGEVVEDEDYCLAFVKMAAKQAGHEVKIMPAGQQSASSGGGWELRHLVIAVVVALLVGLGLGRCEAPDEGPPGTPSQQVER